MSIPRPAALGAAATALASAFALATPAHAAIVTDPVHDSAPDATVSIKPIGSYDTKVFDKSAAEIVAYHAASKRLLTVNANAGVIDVLDVNNPANPTRIGSVSGGEGTTINSVAVRADGLAVATVEPATKTEEGELIFFNAGASELASEPLGRVTVGALPDMVTLTADGSHALVANEGEPASDYSVDPEGSVSVIALRSGVEASEQEDVRTADFSAFNTPGELPDGVHVFGQVGDSATVAQNLEPEYITVSGGTAYVSLQENNAIAVVDIASASVKHIFPLGYQDRTTVAFDASDKDDRINLRNWPIKGILQPDAIASYSSAGETYIVTANEGDSRDWDAYSEEERLKDFGKKGIAPVCDNIGGLSPEEVAAMRSDAGAGRLNMSTAFGLNDESGCYDELYAFGGRSFSIFSADGTPVFDSGEDFERITARVLPDYFNSNHTKAEFDARSDDKGPEPEGVTLGTIDGRTYAFIGFERVGGVMVYDITDPYNAKYQTYLNNRDFATNAGDLGPEGLTFIPASDSPNGKNLLAVGNEVSGTTTVYQVDSLIAPPAAGETSPGSSSSLSSFGLVAGILAALLGAIAALAGAVMAGILPNPLG